MNISKPCTTKVRHSKVGYVSQRGSKGKNTFTEQLNNNYNNNNIIKRNNNSNKMMIIISS